MKFSLKKNPFYWVLLYLSTLLYLSITYSILLPKKNTLVIKFIVIKIAPDFTNIKDVMVGYQCYMKPNK